jgi:phage/plasmid-like protein (TIGR03299 family)
MSHELEIVNGEAQMAYAGDTPWHGLGVKVPADLSPIQMLDKAGLNWSVEKESLITSSGHAVPDKKALVRSSDNKVLDIVGKDWNPVQNQEAFEFFDDFVSSGDMEMHTAGSLKGGQIVWALAKVKESFKVFGNDEVESYLLFSNPHRFGQSVDVRFTPIRVVCNNTLTLSLQTKSETAVKLNHKKAFDADQVKEMLGIASFKLQQYKEMAEFLGSKRFDGKTFNEYLTSLFPSYSKAEGVTVSKPHQRVLELVDTQPGAEFAAGSWWSAFNAVTYFTDHERGRDADARLQSAWYGQSKGLKLKALESAIEFAEAA